MRTLAKDGVLGLSRGEPIEVGVVGDIQEELAAAGIRHAGDRHGERALAVCIFRNVLEESGGKEAGGGVP